MTDSIAYLLDQVSDLRTENKYLRRQVSDLRRSRDRWRKESGSWQWEATNLRGKVSRPSPYLSPTERAEASEVG